MTAGARVVDDGVGLILRPKDAKRVLISLTELSPERHDSNERICLFSLFCIFPRQQTEDQNNAFHDLDLDSEFSLFFVFSSKNVKHAGFNLLNVDSFGLMLGIFHKTKQMCTAFPCMYKNKIK